MSTRITRLRFVLAIAGLWGSSLALATPATAQLVNSGFEDGGGSMNAWTTFNNVAGNVAATTTTPLSGAHAAKVFGGFNGAPNYSGLYQGIAATAGQVLQATCSVRHNTGDSLVGTANHVVMKVEFYNLFGAPYGLPHLLQEMQIEALNASSPVDWWSLQSFQVTAPPGTVEARLSIVFIQPGNQNGAALIDNVSLTLFSNPPPGQWQLIWNDEFDGPAVDTTKWRVQDLHLIKNNELQYYAPDEVYLQNGNLVLRSRQRVYWGYDSNGNWGQYNYTSGLVESINRFGTAYGRIEIRAKLPGTQGIWPALWALPTSGGWPPEIDIMELLGHQPSSVYMSHHWGTAQNLQSFTEIYTGPNFTQGFHTFAINWWPDRIDWYVDDVLRASDTNSIPREPFYIILNTAVGGSWPGNPNGSTVFPQYHEIDYVRVYTLADPGPPLSTIQDGTWAAGTPDGVIQPGEYASFVRGINGGLGDRIGLNTELYLDSAVNGRLTLGFDSTNAWLASYGAVLYLDTAPGGFNSTFELTDVASPSRRLASGKGASGQRADLYFAPGFLADFAICCEPNAVSIYQLSRGSHVLVNGANLGAATDFLGGQDVMYRLGSSNKVREIQLALADLGLSPGGGFNFVASMLNLDTAFRSNEFVGVAAGNPWDSFNPGNSATVLKVGDFRRFLSVPCGMPGDLDCSAGVSPADIEAFVEALTAPADYQLNHPLCDLCAADLNADGLVNGADIGLFTRLLLMN